MRPNNGRWPGHIQLHVPLATAAACKTRFDVLSKKHATTGARLVKEDKRMRVTSEPNATRLALWMMSGGTVAAKRSAMRRHV